MGNKCSTKNLVQKQLDVNTLTFEQEKLHKKKLESDFINKFIENLLQMQNMTTIFKFDYYLYDLVLFTMVDGYSCKSNNNTYVCSGTYHNPRTSINHGNASWSYDFANNIKIDYEYWKYFKDICALEPSPCYEYTTIYDLHKQKITGKY